jgi:hypothetical protein
MTRQTNTGAAQAVPTTDARAWLAAWADHGGIALLAGNRLYVSRMPGLDQCAAQSLDRLKRWLWSPGAADALAGVLSGLAGLYDGEVSA